MAAKVVEITFTKRTVNGFYRGETILLNHYFMTVVPV